LFVPKNATLHPPPPTHTHIYILNYITNAPICFGDSASSTGSFDIAVYETLKLFKLHKALGRSMLKYSDYRTRHQERTLELRMMLPLPHFINSIGFIIKRLTALCTFNPFGAGIIF